MTLRTITQWAFVAMLFAFVFDGAHALYSGAMLWWPGTAAGVLFAVLILIGAARNGPSRPPSAFALAMLATIAPGCNAPAAQHTGALDLLTFFGVLGCVAFAGRLIDYAVGMSRNRGH